MVWTLLMLATFAGLGLPAALVTFPWALLSGDATPIYRAAMLIARAGLRMARVRVEVEGREAIPARTACIFMANHVSNLDPPALLPHLPGRTSAFLKRSLMRIPVLGYGFRLGDFIPVDRDGRVESAQQSAAEAAQVLASGLHITIFVEGTRSPDGRMRSFKNGPFYLAMKTGSLCVPVSIYGTEKLMPKGRMAIRPGTAHVVFHAALDPAQFGTREELMEAMRAAIASGLPEWMRSGQ